MRKRFLSIALAMVTALMIPLSACGKSKPEFDPSIFERSDSYSIDYNEVSGTTTVLPADWENLENPEYLQENPEAWANAGIIIYDISTGQILENIGKFYEEISAMERDEFDITDYYVIVVAPSVAWDESDAAYTLMVMVESAGDVWPNIFNLVIKVGQRSYVFSECKMTNGAGSTQEAFMIVLNEDVIPFMNDLMEHQDEEIDVRITAERGDMEFSLSDKQKKDIIGLYELFDLAGGTNEAYMEKATESAAEEFGEYYNQKVEVRELYN